MTDTLREQIAEAVGEYSGTVMKANPSWVFDTTSATKLVDQIFALLATQTPEDLDEAEIKKLIADLPLSHCEDCQDKVCGVASWICKPKVDQIYQAIAPALIAKGEQQAFKEVGEWLEYHDVHYGLCNFNSVICIGAIEDLKSGKLPGKG